MNPALDAFLRSWPFDGSLVVALTVTAAIYFVGWLQLRRRSPRRWNGGRLSAFLGGLAAAFLALGSPIEPFSSLLLSVHMVQHLLLIMVTPPLIWLGAPFFPCLRGIPRPVRLVWIEPLLRMKSLRGLFRTLTHPLAGLPIFAVTIWFWHAPVPYEWALRLPACHYLEHACFFGAGLIFWFPVVRPYPSRPTWSLWLLVPYLILADVQNTLLSALLTFADRPLYAYYAQLPSLGGLSARDDQAAAGVIMWVPGSVAYLVPLFAIGVRLLLPAGARRLGVSAKKSISPSGLRTQLPVLQAAPRAAGFDALHVPWLGRFLRWRYARLALQLPLALGAAVLIFDGLRGPQIAAVNLAGVLPWIHWRGLLVLTLLLAGNFFCTACPFTLPRRLAGRWFRRDHSWPHWLRGKWLALGLLAVFFWAYETFSLWNSPRETAWLVIGYFVSAFLVDSLFRSGSFCKYVCPIGQFNFACSLVSPLEIKVRSADVCASCQSHDCIRGRPGFRGCEARLFQPQKTSNMDCTFCLDCIQACPRENVGLLASRPGTQLLSDGFGSGIGQFARRPDLAAVVFLLVFASLANAAGMVEPVLAWEDRLRLKLGSTPGFVVPSVFMALSLVVLPAILVAVAASMSRWLGRLAASPLEVATRFSYALIPLGFGMWLAHYGFHFITSWQTALPAFQRALQDLGATYFGDPHYRCACCQSVGDWLPRLEILFLDGGLLLSLYAAYRIALTLAERTSRALKAFVPWGVLIVVLFAIGVWIVFQPMQMRGTLPGAS